MTVSAVKVARRRAADIAFKVFCNLVTVVALAAQPLAQHTLQHPPAVDMARLEGQRFRHQSRRLDERAGHLALVLFGQHAAGTTGRERKTEEHRELAGERLGRGNPDFGAG